MLMSSDSCPRCLTTKKLSITELSASDLERADKTQANQQIPTEQVSKPMRARRLHIRRILAADRTLEHLYNPGAYSKSIVKFAMDCNTVGRAKNRINGH